MFKNTKIRCVSKFFLILWSLQHQTKLLSWNDKEYSNKYKIQYILYICYHEIWNTLSFEAVVAQFSWYLWVAFTHESKTSTKSNYWRVSFHTETEKLTYPLNYIPMNKRKKNPQSSKNWIHKFKWFQSFYTTLGRPYLTMVHSLEVINWLHYLL